MPMLLHLLLGLLGGGAARFATTRFAAPAISRLMASQAPKFAGSKLAGALGGAGKFGADILGFTAGGMAAEGLLSPEQQGQRAPGVDQRPQLQRAMLDNQVQAEDDLRLLLNQYGIDADEFLGMMPSGGLI